MLLEMRTAQAIRDLASQCREAQRRTHEDSPHPALVHSSIREAVERAYPIACALLNNENHDWERLMNAFIETWPLHHPQIWRMPGELCDFVRERGRLLFPMLPFLYDLLRFEWVEIEVFMAPDPTLKEGWQPEAEAIVALNPARRVLELQYPVFDTTQLESCEASNYYLLCVRHPRSNDVSYVQLTKVVAHLIDQLPLDEISSTALLHLLRSNTEAFASIEDCMRDLETLGVLL